MRTAPIKFILLAFALVTIFLPKPAFAGRFAESPTNVIITTSHTYPEYDPTWTTNDCADYSFAGLNEAYGRYSDCSTGNEGFNNGWVDDNDETQPNGNCKYEGVDCSAFVGRCWALPGFMPENVQKSHGRTTTQIYRTGYWDKNNVQRSHQVNSNATSVVNELLQCIPWDIFVVNSDAAAAIGITQADGTACTTVNHAGLIRKVNTSNSDVSTREAVVPVVANVVRTRSWFVDRCARFHRRDDWGTGVVAPTITGQPHSRTNFIGENASFSVTATGTTPTYQWRWNGTNILSATNSSYTRTNVQFSNSGTYSVVVSNSAGSVTSANATLVVISSNHAPLIAPVADQIVHAGSRMTISALAYDADPNDILTFTSDPNLPTASIDSKTGVFTWDTCDDDAGTEKLITLRVADNGQPSLSGTTTFLISVEPRPSVQSRIISENTLTLTWNAISGATYRVEYKTNLNATEWRSLGSEIVADDAIAAAQIACTNTPQMFYRVVVTK